MTLSVKHTFQSAKGDGGDTSKVQPSNWNAEHALTMATGKVLGRQTAGTGSIEELTLSALGASIIAAGSASALADVAGTPTTGDMKIRLGSSVLTGWVRLNGRTIGDASSGATERANADCQALYQFLWDNFSNTLCPVSSGRGVDSATDFAAHKTIQLPDARGRGLFGLDDMGNSAANRITTLTQGTAITPGSNGGAETHLVAQVNLPNVQLAVTGTVSGSVSGTTGAAGNHTHTATGVANGTSSDPFGFQTARDGGTINQTITGYLSSSGNHTHSFSGNLSGGTLNSGLTAALGSGTALNTMPPFMLVGFYVKL